MGSGLRLLGTFSVTSAEIVPFGFQIDETFFALFPFFFFVFD
jgi:hypothetical protein